jgi:hypothetical protein
VLKHLSQDRYEAAFRTVLATQDDIYLLRLLHKTGSCLERLTP